MIHQIGAAVLARIKPLGLCQPGIGYPCPRYLADDFGRAAQLIAEQVAVRVAAVDENRWLYPVPPGRRDAIQPGV